MNKPERVETEAQTTQKNFEERAYPGIIDTTFKFYGKILSVLLRLKAEPDKNICQEQIRDVSAAALNKCHHAISAFEKTIENSFENSNFYNLVEKVKSLEKILEELNQVDIYENLNLLRNLHSGFFEAFDSLNQIIDELNNSQEELKQNLTISRDHLKRFYDHIQEYLNSKV